MSRPVAYRRAMILMTASSMSVPVFGLLSAPLLAHILGVAGRGATAAAVAPNLLVVGVATLGMNDAVTFFVARRPLAARAALARAGVLVGLAGVAGVAIVLAAAPYLAAGDGALARLIVIASILAIPALVVSVFRGAATGLQMWVSVAIERASGSFLRLVLLVVLASTSSLDVQAAVLVTAITPLVGVMVYWRLLRRPSIGATEVSRSSVSSLELLAYGSKTWLGSVAVMVTGRLSQLLVTPLSDVRQLGLLVVAITISDVPYMFSTTIRDVVFGVGSGDSDPARLARTSRLATLIAFSGSLVLGVTLPWWIGLVFGGGFTAAIVPTWILLASSTIVMPGLIAGAALAAAERPGLRSLTLVLTLVVNFVGLVVLVPVIGAVGAASAALVANLVLTVLGLALQRRLLGTRVMSMLPHRRSDILDLVTESTRLLGRLRRGRPAIIPTETAD